MDLPRAFKIAFAVREILRHHAELDIRRPKNVPDLPQHFLHPHVAAGVARPVVARKEQFQLFARGPRLAATEHPAKVPQLDERADPRNEKKVRHALALPTVLATLAWVGQGFAG